MNSAITPQIQQVGKNAKNNFAEFINNNNLLPTMIGVTMGFATNDLIKSFVNNIVMRIIEPILGDEYEENTITIGSIKLHTGNFLSSLLHFIFILLVLYLVLDSVFRKFVTIEKKKWWQF